MKKYILIIVFATLICCKKKDNCGKIKLFSPIENIKIGDYKNNVKKELEKYKQLNILKQSKTTKKYYIVHDKMKLFLDFIYCYNSCSYLLDQGNQKNNYDNSMLVGVKLTGTNNKKVLEQLKVFRRNNPKLNIKEHLLSNGSCIASSSRPFVCIYSDKAKYSSFFGVIDCNK